MISKIYNYSEEEIINLINKSNSISEFLSSIGLSASGSGSRKAFYKYVEEHNLQQELLNLKERTSKKLALLVREPRVQRRLTYEEMFCENSSASRHIIKKYLLRTRLIEYKCAGCGNDGEWNGKELSLQLDHINGINNDNRLENLRFLCPNCHSQTETFSGKHKSLNTKKPRKTPKVSLVEDKIINTVNLELERWRLIENSDIDFSKFGWVKELSKLFNISENKAGVYVKKHYPEFYETKCFKRL